MDDNGARERDPAEPGPPLPPRDPKPWYVHWAADSLVAFLLVVPFFLTNLGVGLFIGLVVGAAAMPFTQRLEARHLAEREQPPGPGD